MFTGIIEEIGQIQNLSPIPGGKRISIRADKILDDLQIDQSVAVNGVCLTVIEISGNVLSAEAVGETLEKSTLTNLKASALVNLERAMKLNDRLGGHLVQGHVDTVGHLTCSVKEGEFWLLDFEIPDAVLSETIEHGSITLNGVSLTVSELLGETGVRIGVIPFTHAHTNLGALTPGDPVNVEGDLIGKYVARILTRREQPETADGS